ncbi:hypothetical protein MATL_G00000640 [Megalops atlanticus]|uniref:Uncharacterized protein n=1 Tax=Megalops atlanticus TaxID=7932 RepID=A0A9D3QFH5_MEGAT|nr:hypothetical protein MATL_G00000640 [Megalops atlanticus]
MRLSHDHGPAGTEKGFMCRRVRSPEEMFCVRGEERCEVIPCCKARGSTEAAAGLEAGDDAALLGRRPRIRDTELTLNPSLSSAVMFSRSILNNANIFVHDQSRGKFASDITKCTRVSVSRGLELVVEACDHA